MRAILSVILLSLNVYAKNFNLVEISLEHQETPDLLWKVSEEYVSLLTDFEVLDANEIMKKSDELQIRTAKVYSNSLRTSSKDYKKTKSIKKEEEQIFSEKEIDIIIPNSIR